MSEVEETKEETKEEETKEQRPGACVVGDGIIDTEQEVMALEYSVSFFSKSYWDLWLQKIFRNLASAKYQWLLLLYIPTIWGIFHLKPNSTEPWISAGVGLGFLGGGFVTLALGRIVSRTKLVESTKEDEEDESSYKKNRRKLTRLPEFDTDR